MLSFSAPHKTCRPTYSFVCTVLSERRVLQITSLHKKKIPLTCPGAENVLFGESSGWFILSLICILNCFSEAKVHKLFLVFYCFTIMQVSKSERITEVTLSFTHSARECKHIFRRGGEQHSKKECYFSI